MLATILLTLSTFAGTFTEADSPQALAAASSAVVQGVVTDVATTWHGRGLVTTYTVEVKHALRGARPDTVTVTLPGGHDGGRTQRYAGVPVWDEGAEVVVFVPTEGPVSLHGVLTVRDGEVVDPMGHGVRPMPATVFELEDAVRLLPKPK